MEIHLPKLERRHVVTAGIALAAIGAIVIGQNITDNEAKIVYLKDDFPENNNSVHIFNSTQYGVSNIFANIPHGANKGDLVNELADVTGADLDVNARNAIANEFPDQLNSVVLISPEVMDKILDYRTMVKAQPSPAPKISETKKAEPETPWLPGLAIVLGLGGLITATTIAINGRRRKKAPDISVPQDTPDTTYKLEPSPETPVNLGSLISLVKKVDDREVETLAREASGPAESPAAKRLLVVTAKAIMRQNGYRVAEISMFARRLDKILQNIPDEVEMAVVLDPQDQNKHTGIAIIPHVLPMPNGDTPERQFKEIPFPPNNTYNF